VQVDGPEQTGLRTRARTGTGAARPTGSRRTDHIRRLVSLGDQVLSGLSNFLTIALVARSSTPGEFGRFTLAYAVVLTLLNLVRGLWGTQIALAGSPIAAVRTLRSLLGATVLAAPVMMAIVSIPVFVLGDRGEWSFVVAIAISAPLVCAQDLCRYGAVSCDRPAIAALSDGLWVLIVLIGYVFRPAEAGAIAVWLGGGVLALLVAAVPLGALPSLPRGWRALRSWHATGAGVATTNIAIQVGSYAALAIAAAVAGTAAAGALRGASSVMAPVNTLLGFLTLALLPMVHRRDPAQHVGVVVRIGVLLLGAAAAWSAVLLVLPRSVGGLLLGETWPLARHIIPWTCLEYMCIAIGAAALLGIQARQAGGLLVKVGLVGAALLAVGGVAAGVLGGTTTAFAISQATAAAVGTAAIWAAYLHLTRHSSGHTGGTVGATPPSTDPGIPHGA